MSQMSYPVKRKLRYPQTPSYKSLKVSESKDKADILLQWHTNNGHCRRSCGKRLGWGHVALQSTHSNTGIPHLILSQSTMFCF